MEKPRLSKSEVKKYGLYSLLTGFASMMALTYITNYATINLALGAALVGTVFLVARIIDFIASLAAGGIITKANPRGGKYTSWLTVLRWTAVIGTILQFTNTASLALPFRVVILLLGYCFLHCSMDFVATSQYSILSIMAGTSMEDRTLLSVTGFQWMVPATIIVSFCTLPVVQFLTPYTGENMAYFIITVVYALPFFLGAEILIRTARPYEQRMENVSAGTAITVKDMVRSVFNNKQLLVVLLAFIMYQIAFFATSTMMYFFFAYVMGNELLMSAALTATTVFSLVSVRIGPKIGAKLGKKRAMVYGLLLSAVGCICYSLFGSISIYMYIIIACFISIAMYMFFSFQVVYMLDAGEYGLWKTGVDNRTVCMSLANVPMKVGLAIGGAVGTYGLAAIGFDSFMAGTIPLEDFSTKLLWLFGVAPAVFNAIGALIMALGYKITDADAARYTKENAEKMAAMAVGK